MKFEDFIKKGLARRSVRDIQLAKSLADTAEQDMRFLRSLSLDSISARKIVSSYYDILRSLLEADSALNGFKIYSHEAFAYYLIENKEIEMSVKFERLRKIRNSINYYGKMISVEEADDAIKEIAGLIDKIKSKLQDKLRSAENEK